MSYKLHVKVGESEFNAEGTESVVKEQFDQFLAILGTLGTNGVSQRKPEVDPANLPPRDTPPPPRTADDELFQRAFSFDQKSKVVSLRVMPRTNNPGADALLAILYGFRVLANQTDVGSSPLMAAAKQSGLNVDRIDRIISARSQFVNTGGSKRGRRYALNNPGIAEGQRIVESLFE